jgi:hypothetical protein
MSETLVVVMAPTARIVPSAWIATAAAWPLRTACCSGGLREVVAKGLIGMLSVLTLGIANLWLLWDKVAGTIVVDDRTHRLG